ncbi:MAG: hypothetical protein ABI114_10820 [Rhodanobacter sp.]
MGMHVDGGFSFNSIVWLTSLPQGEIGLSKRMIEDVRGVVQCDVFDYFPASAAVLRDLLVSVRDRAQDMDLKPILLLDMHGSTDGLHAGDSSVLPWSEVASLLRSINVETGNNLCVIGSACYALHAIKPINLHDPTPFFVLLAPEHLVFPSFLAEKLPRFFEMIFTENSIDLAFKQHLSYQFKYFHCGKLLAEVLATYVEKGLVGRSAQKRRERLLTEIILTGTPPTRENLRNIRRQLKDGLKPTQALLDKYAEPFMIGKPCGFTIEDILNFVEEKIQAAS